MATSPSPFFFPTTAPAYASTTVFPPPSFGFGATAYPYPPPASAYMPASGFSPNWPPPAPEPPPFAPHAFPPTAAYPPTVSGCSPAPIYPFHPTFPSPISSQINPNRPPPAPTPIHGDLHHTVAHPLVLPHPLVLAPPPESSAPPAADSSSSPAVNQLTPTSACAPVATTGNWMQQHRVPTGLNDLAPQLKLAHRSLPDREMDTFQRHTWGTTALARLPLDGFLTDAFDHAPEVTSSAPTSMPQFFSSAATGIGFGSSASSTPTAQTQSSFDTIHGELEKLTSMVSQLAVSIGKRSISAHTSTPATSAAAPAYVAPQVFGEMPTPSSCHGTDAKTPNFYSGHQSPIQNSSVQTGSTNLSEQNIDGRPQPYGFHNLNRQSVFLADGTECSYFTLPADYPLEHTTPPMSHLAAEIVGASTPPSVAAQVACLAPGFCSKANNAAGSESMLLHNLQVPVPVQESPDLFKRMPVYDVYDEDTNASLNCAVELFDTVGQHKQYDVRFSKASDNTFSEEASTDLTFSHGHVIHAERSIKLTNEKSSQAASILRVHEGNVHHNDERPEIDIKKQDVLTNKHDITSPCGLNNGKEVPFVLLYQLPRSSIPCIWDPGIDLFSYKQQHLFSWIPHSAILLLQLLHDKNNSSMCEFSLEKGRKGQWDPGIEFILVELCWFSKGPGYILRHLLAVKFGTHSYTYFRDTTAIMCASPANLIQQRRTIAALFHFWQYKSLSSVVCTWDPGIGISSSIYHWLQSLTAANA